MQKSYSIWRGRTYRDISTHRPGTGRCTAGCAESLVSGSFTAVLKTSGILPAILQHNDKEPDQAACTAAVVRKWLWSKHVCKMCVCHCLLLVLCFHTWSVSHLRSSRLRWWRRSHVVHWHRPSGTSLPRLLSRLNCHVPSYKSPGKFIVLKMKTKKVTHTKKKAFWCTPLPSDEHRFVPKNS